MTEIKFCGMTRLSDALVAAENGANALGFIFYPRSPRYLPPEKARELIRRLPPEVIRVGVFVNEAVEKVKEIYHICGLDLVQLHGDENPDYCRRFPAPMLIRAVSPRNGADLAVLNRYSCRAFLLDRREGTLYGGTGGISNWELGRRIRERFPLILAGGLNPENVMTAIENVLPHAVDINSGVESAPGIKDPEKIRAVLAAVRRYQGIRETEEERKEPERFRIFERTDEKI